MATSRFTRRTETVLRNAGWFPGRKVSTPRLLDYPKIPAAEAFVEEFDGLRLSLPGRFPLLGRLFIGSVVILGPGASPGRERLLSFEKLLNGFCPVGHKDDAEEMVMTSDGRVFIVSAEILAADGVNSPVWLLGSSGDEAIEAVIASKEPFLIGQVPLAAVTSTLAIRSGQSA